MTLHRFIAKIILFPFTVLYGVIITSRNLLYDTGLLKSTSFSVPVISVGNLSIGGAGKTPHIEFLIRILGEYIYVATLSRGYKRKTKGFRFVNSRDSVLEAGDEPLQFKRKYPEVNVAVSESRTLAIPIIMKAFPYTQAVLLDDAFQHRAIIPGLNILLTPFHDPYTHDTLLPAGRLREYPSAYKRADIIIVTKCPDDISVDDKTAFQKELNILPHQKLFLSRYIYQDPYSFKNGIDRIRLSEDHDIILISAIASTYYLRYYLDSKVGSVHQLEYEDHHLFTDKDINYIEQVFNNRDTQNKIILTTEKDAMRLDLKRKKLVHSQLPIYVLPIQVEFCLDEKEEFIDVIKSFLLNFKV